MEKGKGRREKGYEDETGRDSRRDRGRQKG